MRTVFITMLLLLCCNLGCDNETTSTPDAGTTIDGGAQACGEGTAHQQIINAPTTADVVMKVPQHPPIGAGGLP